MNIKHQYFMKIALKESRKLLGNTFPNPSVGVCLVKDGKLLGKAATSVFGRPHAEQNLLKKYWNEAKGATVYVTLEPCFHHGKTEPCVDLIIESGVRQVIIATQDSNPKVGGKSIAKLKERGIEVITGVQEEEARELNAGFFKVQEQGLPVVNVKIAATLDGKIADKNHFSKWITGEKSRQFVHKMRSQHDAILTSINTVLYDDPQMNVRTKGREKYSPIKIVLDSKLRIPLEAKIIQGKALWVFCQQGADGAKKEKLEELGVRVFVVPVKDSKLDLKSILQICVSHGLTRIMVEAGGQLVSSLLKGNLVDNLYYCVAPKILGNDHLPAISDMRIEKLEKCLQLKLKEIKRFDEDVLLIYTPHQ